MQTRFQIREIDLSKGYCLVVTDKNHSKVTFGFDDLDLQLRRLEQFLVYSDDAHREIATVNLLVQRNIPVTFQKSSTDVINDTIQPDESPRVMKAVPVDGETKSKTASSAAKKKTRTPAPRSTPQPRPTATPLPSASPKRGFLFQPFKKN
jgi:hypothetical protein